MKYAISTVVVITRAFLQLTVAAMKDLMEGLTLHPLQTYIITSCLISASSFTL